MNEKIKLLKNGQRTALISSLISFLLAILKAFVGFLSGSVVLIADALESAADIASGLASFFGLRIAQKKPDEKFPYGYYKAENIASLFIGALIIYAAINLLIKSYYRLFTIPEIGYGYIPLVVVAVSGIIALLTSNYLKKKGNQLNIQSLIANSKDRLKDFFVSIIIFIVIALKNIPYIEGIVSILISLVVLRMGILTARDSISALMDVSPSKELENKIKKIINSVSGVEDAKHIRLRSSGPFIFGEGHVKVRKYVNVNRAHEIADKIEEKIKKNVKQIESFTIHIEPFKSPKQKIVIPIKQNKGFNSAVIDHFGRADNFIFIDIDNKKIKSFYIKKNPFKHKKVRAGLSAVNFVIKEKINLLITQQIGDISFHTLRDNLVDIYKTKGKTVKTVVNNLVNNKLEKLSKPTRRKE